MVNNVTSLSITKEKFREMLGELGIEKGDVLYVASSLAAFYDWNEPERDIVTILLDVLGESGTLIMPTFNFGFCQGETFHINETPSHSGKLSEYFRKLPSTQRILNTPFHSVAVIGALAEELSTISTASSFGPQSIFARLLEYNAKQLLLGCSFHDGVVQVHAVEERLGVPYRFWKKMEGDIDNSHECKRQSYFMYARNKSINPILDASPIGQKFHNDGYMQSVSAGLLEMKSFDLKELDQRLEEWMSEDPWVLVANKDANNPGGQSNKKIVLGIDHIGILSKYADKLDILFQSLGIFLSESGIVNELGVECRYYDLQGVRLELVTTNTDDSPLGQYMERHSSHPLHHVAFRVSDIEEAINYFSKKLGVPQLDGQRFCGPREGEVVTFLSPIFSGGLLIELVEVKRQTPQIDPIVSVKISHPKEELVYG